MWFSLNAATLAVAAGCCVAQGRAQLELALRTIIEEPVKALVCRSEVAFVEEVALPTALPAGKPKIALVHARHRRRNGRVLVANARLGATALRDHGIVQPDLTDALLRQRRSGLRKHDNTHFVVDSWAL